MWTALQIDFEQKARMQAMADGVAKLGGRVVSVKDGIAADELLKVIRKTEPRFAYTCGMHRRTARARGLLKGMAVPLLVLDCGYFHRASGAFDEDGYNQLGLGKLCWSPAPHLCTDLRWQAHGISFAPPVQRSGRTLLVLGQVPNDSQHNLSEPALATWLTERAAVWYARGWEIIYRPHPAHILTDIKLPHLRVDPTNETLAESFRRATRILTYNSTAGLEALIAGIPVECDPGAHYAHVADLRRPEALRQHCIALANAQWTCAELRSGEPLRAMEHFHSGLLPVEVVE